MPPTSFLEVHLPSLSHQKGWAPPFENQRCLGKFQITKDRTCVTEDVEFPTVIPESSLPNLLGTYLGTDHANAVLFRNYKAYQELKHKFFLQWIIDCNFFEGVQEGHHKKPDFICFDTRITESMMTPWITRFGDWEMLAAKVNDCIYLWTDKYPSLPHSMESYYGVYYEHILTHEDPTESVPNEYDKVNEIREVTFGGHQLLCLDEIDAVDEKGDCVELRVFKKCSPLAVSAKQLRCWARCIVPGVTTVIVGKRDDSGHLNHIETVAVDAFPQKFEWTAEACYEFQNRFLNWVKSHLGENNPKLVKKFAWSCGSNRVYSSEVPERDIPKAFLPNWYLQAMES